MRNEQPPSLTDFAIRPWIAWGRILLETTSGSAIGLTVIISVFVYVINNTKRPWFYSSLFLTWIGPIAIAIPFLIVIVAYNVLKGDFSLPIPCGRGKTGEIHCL